MQAQGDNFLTSTIPASWLRAGSFPKLAVLGLAQNQLVGTIPSPQPTCGLCGYRARAPLNSRNNQSYLYNLCHAASAISCVSSCVIGVRLLDTRGELLLSSATPHMSHSSLCSPNFPSSHPAPATELLTSVFISDDVAMLRRRADACPSSCHPMQGSCKGHADYNTRPNGALPAQPSAGCSAAWQRKGVQARSAHALTARHCAAGHRIK